MDLLGNNLHMLFCLGMCIGLIVYFREKFNAQGKTSKTVSENAYTMYLILSLIHI